MAEDSVIATSNSSTDLYDLITSTHTWHAISFNHSVRRLGDWTVLGNRQKEHRALLRTDLSCELEPIHQPWCCQKYDRIR